MGIEIIGNNISLVSLEFEHLEALSILATDPEIWKYLSVSLESNEEIYKWYEQAKTAEKEGNGKPFVLRDNQTNDILGSIRLLDLDSLHKTAEIGTWLSPKYFGRRINLEAKLLILTYSFETLHLNRIQFKTDETNLRSQKAIQKIGAKFEGILRNHKIRRNGTLGNSFVYSIISSEWPETKEFIIAKLNEHR